MKFRDIILTANSNLRKSKLRTTLTILAVFIGTLTLMLTTGVGAGLRTYVEEQVNAVGAKDIIVVNVKAEGSQNPIASGEPKEYDPNAKPQLNFGQALQNSDLQKIDQIEGIENVTPLYSTQAEYITTGDKKFQANVTQGVEGLQQPMLIGRTVDVNGKTPEITIPSTFVGALGFSSPDDAVGKQLTVAYKDATGQIFTQSATIVGVQQKSLINGADVTANIVFIKAANETANQNVPAFQKDLYEIAFARFDDSYSKQQIEDLKKRLSDQGYQGTTLDDQLGIIRNVINAVITFLNVFAGITLLAATFGIVNTLLMAVQERTREIGLMKALGMHRSRIFALFSLEAVLIGFWGSVIALGVANILGRIGSKIATNTIFKDFEGLRLFSFPAKQMVLIILIIMLISFLAATLPARRASKLDPIEALRYE